MEEGPNRKNLIKASNNTICLFTSAVPGLLPLFAALTNDWRRKKVDQLPEDSSIPGCTLAMKLSFCRFSFDLQFCPLVFVVYDNIINSTNFIPN